MHSFINRYMGGVESCNLSALAWVLIVLLRAVGRSLCFGEGRLGVGAGVGIPLPRSEKILRILGCSDCLYSCAFEICHRKMEMHRNP